VASGKRKKRDEDVKKMVKELSTGGIFRGGKTQAPKGLIIPSTIFGNVDRNQFSQRAEKLKGQRARTLVFFGKDQPSADEEEEEEAEEEEEEEEEESLNRGEDDEEEENFRGSDAFALDS